MRRGSSICRAFRAFVIKGPGAADWLARQITGKVPNVGRLGLAYFADDKGRIVTEMSVARLAEDELLLITAATAQVHDRDWLREPSRAGLTLTEDTDDWSTQILTGPKSRAILAAVSRGRSDEGLADLADRAGSPGPRCC